MASIQKTPHGWKARVRKHGIDISQSFTNKSHAAAWARRKEKELSEDKALGFAESKLRRLSLGEVALAYLEQYDGRDKERQTRVRWWIDRLGAKSILDVDRSMIRDELEAYIKDNARIRGKVTDRKRGPASHNRQLATLSAVFNWAMDQLDLPSNPCRQVKFRKEKPRALRFLKQWEIDKLLAACKQSRWPKLHLLVSAAITTGCRRSELMGLRWQHIDWENSLARLETKKNDEPMLILFQASVMDELAEFRQIGNGLVFCGKHPMKRFAFDKEWKAAQRRAGIKSLRFHDLRHATAITLAEQGASTLEIADVLGHKSISSTRIYAHLTVESRKKLLKRVFGHIGKEKDDERKAENGD